MGALTGTWHIYPQKIGTGTFNLTPTIVNITKTESDLFEWSFPLTMPIVFEKAGSDDYYLGGKEEWSAYRYRAQTIAHDGLTVLVGHVATKKADFNDSDPYDTPRRCLFIGLPEGRQVRQTFSLNDSKLFEVHLAHAFKTPHKEGKLSVNKTKLWVTREEKTLGTVTHEFEIDEYTEETESIHLATKIKGAKPLQEKLEAKIIFHKGRPIYIGHYWREKQFDDFEGPPNSQFCTRVTIGW